MSHCNDNDNEQQQQLETVSLNNLTITWHIIIYVTANIQKVIVGKAYRKGLLHVNSTDLEILLNLL